jgi:hypothetical protein
MPGSPTPTPRRARHLMDPDNPRPVSRSGGMSLTHVQMWVLSVLAVTTILHLSAGLVAAAFYVEKSRGGAQVGLLVLAAVVGMFAVATGLAIHRKSPLSPWLVLGWLPALAGAYFLVWS